MSDQLKLGGGGTVVSCTRCGATCRLGPRPNPDARLLQFATTSDGVCGTCGVRCWFEASGILSYQPDFKPESLLLPHVQRQFEAVMRVGNADLAPGAINWQKLVDEWGLPVDGPRKPSAARKARGIGVDDLAQARAAKKRGPLN